MAEAEQIFGGWSEERAADAGVQEIADKVKSKVTPQINPPPSDYHAVTYRQQVVAGMNYLIKVHVGHRDEHAHVCVFHSLGDDTKLLGVLYPKKSTDRLEPWIN